MGRFLMLIIYLNYFSVSDEGHNADKSAVLDLNYRVQV